MHLFVNQKSCIVFYSLKWSKSQSLNKVHPEMWPSWWYIQYTLSGLSLTFIRFKQCLILIVFVFTWPLFYFLSLTSVNILVFNTIWGFFAMQIFFFAQGNNRQGCKHCFREDVCWFTYIKSIKIKGNENLIHMAHSR